ncbi:MAG: HK97-gp10 family putative phage morphogenesis protein [Chloroflexota bacterium]
MAAAYKWHKKVGEDFKTKAKKALVAGGLLIEREAKQSMKPGHGRIYKKGKHGTISHQASTPGSPPAVDTGRLRGSVSTNWGGSGRGNGSVDSQASPQDGIGQPAKEQSRFVVVVGTNVEYGKFLELGTRHIRARPWLRPALEKMKSHIMREFSR